MLFTRNAQLIGPERSHERLIELHHSHAESGRQVRNHKCSACVEVDEWVMSAKKTWKDSYKKPFPERDALYNLSFRQLF